jgi:interferon gamma-inducible protein 30
MHKLAQKTASLNPPHNYVPWIVVNGKHTDEIQHAAQDDLLGLICKLYLGVKPEQCRNKEYNNILLF